MAVGASSSVIVVTAVVSTLCLGIGLIVGYLLRPQLIWEVQNGMERVRNRTLARMFDMCDEAARDEPEIERFLMKNELKACTAYTCDIPFPNTYIVYHLGDDVINVDGKLDERGWTDVGWSEPFVDIRGSGYSNPRFHTRVKLRWDDSRLYVGAYLEESGVWANRTLHDTTVYQDNAFQVLFDVQQSNSKYKEITINALGTVADMMLTRPYMDDGEPLSFWESEGKMAVYVDGPVNNPGKPNRFWIVEMSLPFENLYESIKRDKRVPNERESWRANFVRSEWIAEVVGGKYQKRLDKEPDWWVWTSPGVLNIHLPDRWGLIQFRNTIINSTLFHPDHEWLTRNALLEIYRAEKAYRAVYGRYTDKVDKLDLPPYVLSSLCIKNVSIKMDWTGFVATVVSMDEDVQEGHIRTDRMLWMGDDHGEVY